MQAWRRCERAILPRITKASAYIKRCDLSTLTKDLVEPVKLEAVAVNDNSTLLRTSPPIPPIASHHLIPLTRLLSDSAELSPSISINIDTFGFINELQSSGLTREKSEALCDVVQGIFECRLTHLSTLYPTSSQLSYDVSLLQSLYHDFSSTDQTFLNSSTDANIRLQEHLKHELHNLLDAFRDRLVNTKAEINLLLNTYRADARAEFLPLDMTIHATTGGITVASGDFKTAVEHVKIKSVYTWTAVLVGLCLAVVMERAISKQRTTKGSAEIKKLEESIWTS